MDIWAIIFAAILLLAGLLVSAIVLSAFTRGARPQDERRLNHQQFAKAQRQMERRRGRVWWRMDELYTEFVGKAGGDPAAILPPPAEVGPPASGYAAGAEGGEGFTLTDVQEAYEVFLRKG